MNSAVSLIQAEKSKDFLSEANVSDSKEKGLAGCACVVVSTIGNLF